MLSLIILLFVGGENLFAQSNYSYEVKPILSNFNAYVYVKTNNPDPKSFKLLDKSSKYSVDAQKHPSFELDQNVYMDVEYENPANFRVRGGYIFRTSGEGYSDGGKLSIYTKNSAGNFVDSGKTVTAPAMTDIYDYLFDNHLNDNMTKYDKLTLLDRVVNSLSVYPHPFQDESKPTGHYPLLAVSPYPELHLNEHFEGVYEKVENPSFLYNIYPFILNSASQPGLMAGIAEHIDPNAIISSSFSHAYLDIKFSANDEPVTVGGAGSGGRDAVFTKHLSKLFTFDNSSTDFANKSLNDYKDKLLNLKSQATADAKVLYDQVAGKTFAEHIAAGNWIKTATEGYFGFGETISYVAAGPEGKNVDTWIVSDAWVDGRYVSVYENLILGESFADHPEADIVIRNMSYVDKNGVNRQQDVVFSYDKASDTWRAPFYYAAAYGYSSAMKLPDNMILTRAEVMALVPDRNTNKAPLEGLIYSGQAKPGTPFTDIALKGISAEKEISVPLYKSIDIADLITFSPANASWKTLKAESSNPSVVNVDYSSLVGIELGTANISVTSYDGAHKLTIKVNVVDYIQEVYTDTNDLYNYYLGGYYNRDSMEAVYIPASENNLNSLKIYAKIFQQYINKITVKTRLGEERSFNLSGDWIVDTKEKFFTMNVAVPNDLDDKLDLLSYKIPYEFYSEDLLKLKVNPSRLSASGTTNLSVNSGENIEFGYSSTFKVDTNGKMEKLVDGLDKYYFISEYSINDIYLEKAKAPYSFVAKVDTWVDGVYGTVFSPLASVEIIDSETLGIREHAMSDGVYLMDNFGKKYYGWHLIAGVEKYFDPLEAGKRAKGVYKIGQTVYLFDSNGRKQIGWHVIDGKQLYFSPQHGGGLLTGIRTIGKTTYLLTAEGKKYGWHRIDGKDYYFDPNSGGGMVTGIRTIGQTTYLLSKDGKKMGWHQIDGKDYYFDPNSGGGMVTGIRTIGQTTYLLSKNGKQMGWHRIDGKDYYFDPNSGGGMITGWRTVNGTRYYFNTIYGYKERQLS